MLDFMNKQISLMIIAVRVCIHICFLCKKINKQAQEWLNNHRAQHQNQTNNNNKKPPAFLNLPSYGN